MQKDFYQFFQKIPLPQKAKKSFDDFINTNFQEIIKRLPSISSIDLQYLFRKRLEIVSIYKKIMSQDFDVLGNLISKEQLFNLINMLELFSKINNEAGRLLVKNGHQAKSSPKEHMQSHL